MGTSSSICNSRRNRRDHPHAYGDKIGFASVIRKLLGSSPRVWGQDLTNFLKATRTRIIPTRMGTRRSAEHPTHTIRDHPHAYGDKVGYVFDKDGNVGSSPRVWGQACCCKSMNDRFWIIPTRMGTSYQKTTNCTLIRDHPHAYGDKKSKCLTRGSAKGSSPRVWGQAVANILHPKEVGIIPTRMGTRSTR